MSRALSGFGEAYRRAAYRTNTSGSPCPFKRFPYLMSVNASSLDERLSRALDVLQKHGRLGLGVARVRFRCTVRCSSWRLEPAHEPEPEPEPERTTARWPARRAASRTTTCSRRPTSFGMGGARPSSTPRRARPAPHLATTVPLAPTLTPSPSPSQAGRQPPVTRVLRLESLRADFARFCTRRASQGPSHGPGGRVRATSWAGGRVRATSCAIGAHDAPHGPAGSGKVVSLNSDAASARLNIHTRNPDRPFTLKVAWLVHHNRRRA